MANARMIECPTCKGEGCIPYGSAPCTECQGEGEIENPDYDPSPCCSGVATGGAQSCHCSLTPAENE